MSVSDVKEISKVQVDLKKSCFLLEKYLNIRKVLILKHFKHEI